MAETPTPNGKRLGSAAARTATARSAGRRATTHAHGATMEKLSSATGVAKGAKSKLASATGAAKGGKPLDIKLPKKLQATNDSASRLQKKGASAEKVAKAQAVDAKASKAKVIGTKAGASKTGKLTHVAKGIAEGAAGKNAAGKAAGGQLTGAIAGGAQAVLQVVKPKQLLVIGVILIMLLAAPFIAEVVIGFAVVSVISGQESGVVSGAVAGTYGKTAQGTTSIANLSAQGADNTHTPSTLVSALAYYESGAGEAAAQSTGTCPPKAPKNALCPAMEAAATPSGTPIATTKTSGLTPAVGRNAEVPHTLLPTSTDFVSTNTADWACIRQAESNDNYTDPHGAYGFIPSTWASLTNKYPDAGAAPASVQNGFALTLLSHEGHFWGTWGDSCTHYKTTGEAPMTAVTPGVDVPASPGTKNSYGSTPLTVAEKHKSTSPPKTPKTPTTPTSTTTTTTTPTKTTTPAAAGCTTGTGPYCVTGTLPAKTRTRPRVASAWVAQQITSGLRHAGYKTGPVDLTAYVNVTTPPNAQPYAARPTPQTAIATSVEAALAKLPITGQSSQLDANVYLLATDWATGYSPPILASTAATTPCPLCGVGPIPPGAAGTVIKFEEAEVKAEIGYVWGGGHTTKPGPSMGVDGKGVPACKGGKVVATAEGAGNTCTKLDETLAGQPGLDCSGFVRLAWSKVGVTLNGAATTQYQVVKHHSGLILTHKKLVAGDLMFYDFGRGGVGHVATYIGGGKEIQEAQTGTTAQIVPAYYNTFVGGGMP